MKKNYFIKSIFAFCILHFAIYYSATAQIQQNQNVRVVDTVYTPAGYPGTPLPPTSILWLPSITNGAAVVLVHGCCGSTPDDYKLWGEALSSLGYVVLSIEYWAFNNPHGVPDLYPDPVRAIKTAAEFLRKNSLKFGNYTGKVAVIGGSGGAFHIGQTIIWDNDDAYFGTDPAINDHFDAAVMFYGWYDYYNYLQSIFPGGLESVLTNYFSPNPSLRSTKGNPFTNINNITSPILMFHGTADQVFQVEQSEEFRDSLVAHNKNVRLELISGADHVYDYHNYNFNQWSHAGLVSRDTAIAWLSRTLQVSNIHCPYNVSYWKNHSIDWNNDAIPMMLGTTNSYSKSQLLAILNSSSGDESIQLAKELIAAKLNLANNTVASPITTTIITADGLIGNRAIPIVPSIASNSAEGIQMTSLKNTLNAYNNGKLTPNCNNGGNMFAKNNYSDISTPDPVSNATALSIFPNPVSNTTTIYFSLSQSQKVSLKIFDVNGRLVTTLANEQMQAGVHELKWNANNSSGRTVSSGVYLLRIEARDFKETRKISVIK